MRRTLTAAAAAAALAFGGAGPAGAQTRTVPSGIGPVTVATFAGGLEHPWGLAFLPDGRMLVTERPGRLRIVAGDGRISAPVGGVPRVFAQGQGGLLDVALHPGFGANGLVYLSYAEAGAGGASTAVARGRLEGGALRAVEVIFRQQPKHPGQNHFGSRLAFAPDGKLFVTTGERFRFDLAQGLGNHLGKVLRINADGSVPPGNPFVGQGGARPEIWSYGHRNVEGAAIHPTSGVLWTLEFGPEGGDELNVPRPGRNYGWPLVSWGEHYSGEAIPDPPTRPDLADAVRHWTPAISPSGMTFYRGDRFPGWDGDILVAALGAQALVRLELDGRRVVGEERIGLGQRIRDVEAGPDGAIYLLTGEAGGEILRLAPAARATAGG